MIRIGTQYYRPPFPRAQYWEDDLARMRDAGLNTVQLWLLWSWIEASPGRFRYDDYDRIISLAEKKGLQVVLSTIAAVHPLWIHREEPGSEMITNMGHQVVSTTRREVHHGLSPGGCLDHPGVQARMERFLRTTAERYADSPAIAAWDVWNELRWNVHADGLVCYCDHSVAAFRSWLQERYGDLDELNRAWERRYGSWEEVRPGKRPSLPYTENMAFGEFLTARAVVHGTRRYRVVKAADPEKPVTVHGGKPTVLYGTDGYYTENPSVVLDRGNDWGFAEEIDGVGTSSFPVWERIDLADFIARVDFVGAAAAQQGRSLWLSELQGGRSATGFKVQRPVAAAVQQRWIWSGLAAGADTVLFWAWRDEVFGRESGGFGLTGGDGLAADRVAALQHSSEVLRRYRGILEGYRPRPGKVGIWFSPRTYYLHWSEEGHAERAMRAIQGPARVMVERSIPYTIVEEEHYDRVLHEISVLFMPRALVTDPTQEEALARFVERGGTLVVESETGAFGSNGLYRYPHERFLSNYFGIREVGRRSLPSSIVPVSLQDDRTYLLPAAQWATPFENGALLQEQSYGAGRIVAVGLYNAEAFYAGDREEAESYAAAVDEYRRFVADMVDAADAGSPVVVLEAGARLEASGGRSVAHVRVGDSNGVPVIFVVSSTPHQALTVEIRDRGLLAQLPEDLLDLLSGETVRLRRGRVTLPASEWGVAALVPRAAAESA